MAFGSCNREDLPQDIWDQIGMHKPEIWVWLGDNIYGDSEDMDVLKAKYLRQKQSPAYTSFRRRTLITGIWDDHDYGVNDGGKEYPYREQSKELMLDFLDVPQQEVVRRREGAYQAYMLGPPGKRIKLLLLDSRYFRDTLEASRIPGKRYERNETGDILGEAQWTWLRAELTDSPADCHIIANGIQVIPAEQGFEKWDNFPVARRRLLDLLAETRPNRPVLLSGDRHIAEYSRLRWGAADLPEVTSSGLTHTWSRVQEEANRHRVGRMVVSKNFGLLHFDWAKGRIWFEIRDEENRVQLTETLWGD